MKASLSTIFVAFLAVWFLFTFFIMPFFGTVLGVPANYAVNLLTVISFTYPLFSIIFLLVVALPFMGYGSFLLLHHGHKK